MACNRPRKGMRSTVIDVRIYEPYIFSFYEVWVSSSCAIFLRDDLHEWFILTAKFSEAVLFVCLFCLWLFIFLHYLFTTPQTVPDMMLIANPIGINEKSRLNLHPIVPPHFTFYLHCPSPSGTGRASGQCSPRERRKKKSPSTQECGLKGLDKKKKRTMTKQRSGWTSRDSREWVTEHRDACGQYFKALYVQSKVYKLFRHWSSGLNILPRWSLFETLVMTNVMIKTHV